MNLPAQATGEMTTSAGPWQLSWKLEGAKATSLELDQGRALYPDAYPATDVVMTAEPARVETFFLLRDESAPSEFSWKVNVPSGLEAKKEADGGIAFIDKTGSKRLRVGKAKAVDAKGMERAATLAWQEGRLSLSLDTTGLVHPILLDPPVETVVWEVRHWGQPGPRWAHSLAYDSARGRVVLFGGLERMGNSDRYSSDTLEWDGTIWTPANPASSPPARSAHSLAYDNARGKVVLFGGAGNDGYLSDTWEWDGTNWKQLSPASSPPARYAHSLAYDSARGKVVLFGGEGAGVARFSDTWEWDGTNWKQLSPASSPPARYGHSLAYDSARGKVVLFGGNGSSGRLADTWEWDGTNWKQLSPVSSPSARYQHSLAYDSARGKVVLFGGDISNIWEWDGTNWKQLSPASSPPAREFHSLAYDSARGKVVLFGGDGRSGYLSDTWEWDGTNWKQLSPASRPPARSKHALAYDSAREKVVLFGGESGGRLSDTWEWDGTNWKQLSPASRPPARREHSLAYDSARGKVVLFGGGGPGGLLSDTWEWDGTNWNELSPASSPSARSAHSLAYDSAREKVVLFGGSYGRESYFADTWEWDGTNWNELSPASSPAARHGHSLAYDSARGRMVLFGGDGNSGRLEDTWEYHAFGGGCSSDAECNTGFCVDSVCCTSACEGECMACSVAAGAERDGICGVVRDGFACSDGNACTEGETCQAGVCVGGSPVTCREPDVCEIALACDKTEGCLFEPKPSGTLCRAGVCDEGQALSAGVCDGASAACPAAVPMSCGQYICAEGACLSSCESSDDCIASAFCNAGVCEPKQPQGGACTGDEGCADGPCVDGFCCDTSCTGQCEACDIAGQEGTCSPATGAPHGGRAACATDGSACGGACDGTNRGQCAYPTDICRAPSCDSSSNIAILEASCDGQGSCPSLQTTSCAPFVCDTAGKLCAGDCASHGDCIDGHYCSAGICEEKLGNGESCGDNAQCETGHCVDGFCCDTSCTGQCEACDIAGQEGTCSPATGAPHGGRAACAGQGNCQGQCDGTNATSCAYPGSETACGPASCQDGVESFARACDGEGACGSPSQAECGLYVCGETACLSSCESHDDCVADALCINSKCVIEEAIADAGVDTEIDAAEEEAQADEIVSTLQGGGLCRAAPGKTGSTSGSWLGIGIAALALRRGRRRGAASIG